MLKSILAAGPLLALAAAPVALGQAAPSSAPTAAVVAPQARALLKQVITAETDLKAYSGALFIQDLGNVSEETVKVKKPNNVFIKVAIHGVPRKQTVSNGKSVTVLDYTQKKYAQQDAPSGGAHTVLNQDRSLLLELMDKPEQLAQGFTDPQTQSVSLGDPGMAGGVATQTLIVKIAVQPTVVETVTFGIGQDDHLIRSLSIHVTLPATDGRPARPVSHTETWNKFHANPVFTPADFVSTPPPGVKKAAIKNKN